MKQYTYDFEGKLINAGEKVDQSLKVIMMRYQTSDLDLNSVDSIKIDPSRKVAGFLPAKLAKSMRRRQFLMRKCPM
jgi:hypothetical protein